MGGNTNEKYRKLKRIIFDIVLLFSILFGNWIVASIIGLIGIALFNRFYEAIFAGLLLDILYGIPTIRFGGFEYIHTIGAIFIYVVSQYIKPRIR